MSNPNPFYIDNSRLFQNQLYFGLIDLDPIAIGNIQIPENQSECAIAIGKYAGLYNQGECAIAIGSETGRTDQGMMAIAIGSGAGSDTQSELAIALGVDAGSQNQSTGAIAIGTEAGQFSQGVDAIAIGTHAGQTNQPSNSIILNASGVGIASATQASALYIDPIRSVPTGASVLMYSPSSKEISHSDVISIGELAVESSKRVYQEINPSTGWESVNGYYGLAKDAYPALNPKSSGLKAVSSWNSRVSNNAPITTSRFTGVAWSPELSLLVTVGGPISTENSRSLRSSDGITWSLAAVHPNRNGYMSICWSSTLSRFVAVALSGIERIMYSNDGGTTWTYLVSGVQLTNCNNAGGNLITCTSTAGLLVGQFIFIVSGTGSVPTSTTVTAINSPTSFTTNNTITGLSNTTLGADNNWYNVIFVKELGLFVASSDGGATNYRIITSPDGITWTYRYTGVNTFIQQIGWSPELGILVSTGIPQLYSYDGITWTQAPNSPPSTTLSVCWSRELGIFVATGGGDVYNSADGLNWIAYPIPANYRNSVIWANTLGLFVAPVNGNAYWISSDGKVWTSISAFNPFGFGGNLTTWAPELGLIIHCNSALSSNYSIISSSLIRPPTSYNVFDSPFNRIDQLGNWTIQQVLKAGTYTAGTTTPSVAGINLLVISNVAPTKTITNFLNGVTNQVLTLVFNDANTIIQSNVNVRLSGGVNFAATQYDTLQLIFITGSGWLELSRSVNA